MIGLLPSTLLADYVERGEQPSDYVAEFATIVCRMAG